MFNAADFGKCGNFVIHLSTSQLVSQLVIDPEALRTEHHEPGIYDESGDYVPMYSGDPEDLAHIQANPSAPAPAGTDPGSGGGPSEPADPGPSEPSDPDPNS